MAPSVRVRKSSQRIQSRKSATTNNGLSVPATVAKASANAMAFEKIMTGVGAKPCLDPSPIKALPTTTKVMRCRRLPI
jgi:hypothetical protein